MHDIVPRWEFRVFGQDFGEPLAALRGLVSREAVDSSQETYLVPHNIHDRNFKVRNGRLDVKALLDTVNGLERWKPTLNEALPLSRDWLCHELLPLMGHPEVALVDDHSGLAQLAEAFRHAPGVGVVRVSKRRQRFTVEGCPVEHDDILVNGAAIRSMAVESEDPEAVLRVIGRLGLDGRENVDYPRALRRILGFEPWPGDRDDG